MICLYHLIVLVGKQMLLSSTHRASTLAVKPARCALRSNLEEHESLVHNFLLIIINHSTIYIRCIAVGSAPRTPDPHQKPCSDESKSTLLPETPSSGIHTWAKTPPALTGVCLLSRCLTTVI